MSKIVKPAAVALAEDALSKKAEELTAAKLAVQRLESEHAVATMDARRARETADLALPQCRMVLCRWGSTKPAELMGRVVILRKTPKGLLVTRRVGDASGYEYRFKWMDYAGKYTQAEKQGYYASDHRELMDVPPEYMP